MAFFPAAVATTANLYTAVNSLQTTLATALGTGDVSVILASATGFPTAGAVVIGNEVIFYTGVSGATLTGCTRGADGTTAATHTVGVPVGAAIVAFHHNGLMTEVIAIETYLNTKFGTSGTAYTVSRALQTNSSSGIPEVSSVTNTELGYLSGVSSAIQTQFGLKAPLASPTFTGTIAFTGAPTNAYDTTGVIYINGLTSKARVLRFAGAIATDQMFYSGANVDDLRIGTTTGTTITDLITFSASGITIADAGSGLIWTRSTYDTYAWEQAGSGFKLRNTTDGRDEITCDQAGGVAVHGTVTNDNATAGFYGESMRSLVTRASGVSASTTGQWWNITSITLTPGDWLVTGLVVINANGATVTANSCSSVISVNSGNTSSDHVSGDNSMDIFTTASAATDSGQSVPNYRISVNTNTTVYLKALAGYSVATPKGSGRISAVRIR